VKLLGSLQLQYHPVGCCSSTSADSTISGHQHRQI